MKKSTKIKIAVGASLTLIAGGLLSYGYFRRYGWKEQIKSKKEDKMIDLGELKLEAAQFKNNELLSKESEIISSNNISETGRYLSEIQSRKSKVRDIVDDYLIEKDCSWKGRNFVISAAKEYLKLDSLDKKIKEKHNELVTKVRGY